MPRKLNSFMIRWWHGDGTERLELEHVQSGRKAFMPSLQEAVTWLEAQQQVTHDDETSRDDQATLEPN